MERGSGEKHGGPLMAKDVGMMKRGRDGMGMRPTGGVDATVSQKQFGQRVAALPRALPFTERGRRWRGAWLVDCWRSEGLVGRLLKGS